MPQNGQRWICILSPPYHHFMKMLAKAQLQSFVFQRGGGGVSSQNLKVSKTHLFSMVRLKWGTNLQLTRSHGLGFLRAEASKGCLLTHFCFLVCFTITPNYTSTSGPIWGMEYKDRLVVTENGVHSRAIMRITLLVPGRIGLGSLTDSKLWSINID